MPCSNLEGKDYIKDFFIRTKEIKSLVDFGAGMGTYYYLISPVRSDIKMTAVEIFEPYVQHFMLRNYYDEVVVGDMTKIDLPKADCAIFGDVLEHLDKESAKDILKRAREVYKYIVVSIPWGESEGEVVFGNEHEKHRSFWKPSEIQNILNDGFLAFKMTDNMGIYIRQKNECFR